MIELENIKKTFNAGRPNEYAALRGVSLALPMGGLTVIKGPSGSGKTTLLAVMGCMMRPTVGRVRVEGREITSLPERFLTQIRRETFGFVFQQFHLLRGITAIENAMLPLYPVGIPHSTAHTRAMELFTRFHIEAKAQSRSEWLSGGEAQRVAIARALINNPKVLIADEPTAHLDTALSKEFIDIFSDLKSSGMTIIIASHDPVVCDSGIADRVIEIRDGRLG